MAGSTIYTHSGVNPSLTIIALAKRALSKIESIMVESAQPWNQPSTTPSVLRKNF